MKAKSFISDCSFDAEFELKLLPLNCKNSRPYFLEVNLSSSVRLQKGLVEGQDHPIQIQT